MNPLLELIAYIWFHSRRILWKTLPPEPILGPQQQTFPLADLPLVPLLVVIQNMNVRAILSLSAQSTKFKNIAKLHTRKMHVLYRSAGKYLLCDTYEYNYDYPSSERYFIVKVEIKPRCVGGTRNWWDIFWNKPQTLLHVNGCPFYFEEYHGVLRFCHGRIWKCPFGAFPEAINDFLLDMFTGNRFDAHFTIYKQQLPCPNQPFRRVCLLQQDDNLIMPSMLESGLEDLTITEELFVEWKVPEEFRYTKGLRYPKMIIRDAHWLTLESILHMKCVHLTANRARLTDEDVNKIIKKVIEGGLDGLDRIIIGSIHAPRWSKSVLLEGIDWERFNWSRDKPLRLSSSYDWSVKVTGKNGRRIAFGYSENGGEISVIDGDSVQW